MSLGPLRLALLGLLVAVSVAAQPGGPGFSIPGYNEIQNNKTPVLPRRRRLNFVNGGCVDDVANASTDCTVSGTGGGSPGGTVAGAVQYRIDGTTFGGDDNVLDDGAGHLKGQFRDKGGAVFNAAAYGTVGDGTTPDDAAIQLALDTGGIGSQVFLPSGLYRLTTSLLLYESQRLVGATTGGSDAQSDLDGAVLVPDSGITAIKAKTAGTTRTDNLQVEHIGIKVTGANAVGIDLTHVNEAAVRSVAILGTQAAGQIGVRIAANVGTTSGGLGARIEDSAIGLLETGVQLRSTANANFIGPGNRFYQNTNAGVSVEGQCGGGTCTTSDTCQVVGSDTVHRDCTSCSGTSCSANLTGIPNDNRVFKNWFEVNGSDLYDVGKETIFEGNYVEGATLGTCSTTTTQLCQCDAAGLGGTCATPCPATETCIDAPLAVLKGFDTVLTDNYFLTRGESANQPDQIEAQVRGVSGANGVRINLVNNVFRGVGGTQGKGIVEGSLGGASSLNTIGRNVYESLLTKVALLASSQLSWVDTVEGVTFANLPASPGQGSLLLCTDCARTTPCTVGSAGANVPAFYTGTQWDCHVRPPGLNNQIIYNNGGNWGADNFLRWSQGNAGRLNIGNVTGGASSTVHLENDFAVTATQGVYEADLYNNSNTTGPLWISRRARGTPALPAAVGPAGAADQLGVFQGRGHDGTNFSSGGRAQITLNQTEPAGYTSTNQGADIRLFTTLNGTVTMCEKVRVTNDSKLRLFEPQVGSTCGVDATVITAQAQAADVTYTLPATQGGATTFLQNDGAGGLSWQAAVTAAHNFLDSTVHNNTTTGTPVRGDLITAQGGTPTWTRLVLGGTGKLIRSNGTDALYSTFTIPDTYAQGDLLFASATNVLTALAKSTTATRYLANTGTTNNPQWDQVNLANGVTGTLPEGNGGTNQSTYTLGDTLFASAANTLSKLAGNTTATRKFLRQTGTGAVSAAPVWDTLLAGDVPGSALTKTDDTNVTLTLGGTPSTALLAATSLTLGWTGQLSPARGGTGANNTATLGRYLRGDGTNFVTSAVAAGGAGSCTNQFVRAANDNAVPTCNTVVLNTDTSGNYVGTLACGTGVTGCTGAIPAAAPTVGFDYTATLAGNPTLSAGQCVFSNDTSGTNKGGLICEGSGTDANEVYIGVADPTVDRTITFPDASGTVAVSSSQTNNALVKYSGTGGQVAPAGCTESANLISGCNLSGTATGLNCTGCVGPTEIASTTVAAGSYGSSSLIPVITVDVDGRLTAASTAAVVSGFPSSHGISTLGIVAVNTTTYMAESVVDPLESHAQQYVNSTRTVGGFGCVNPVAQGTGANHDIVVTLDTSGCVTGTSNLTASTRTCTLTGAVSGPQTCTSVNGSISVTAGNCMAFKVVTQSAVAAAAVVNCTYDYTG